MSPLAEYVMLFGWSFLAATVLPLGSEFAFVAAVRHQDAALLPVIVATIGNTLGALTTFWLGRRAAEVAEHRRPLPPRVQRAAAMLQRRGHPVLFLSWVPILGDALVAAAGAAHVPWLPAAAWIVLGKAARYAVLGWSAGQV